MDSLAECPFQDATTELIEVDHKSSCGRRVMTERGNAPRLGWGSAISPYVGSSQSLKSPDGNGRPADLPNVCERS